MRTFNFYILAFLITFIFCQYKCLLQQKKSGKDCKALGVEEGFKHCCYAKGSYTFAGQEVTVDYCVPLTEKEYNEIDKYIEDLEKGEDGYKYSVKKIDCKSYYLTISLLSLLFILL